MKNLFIIFLIVVIAAGCSKREEKDSPGTTSAENEITVPEENNLTGKIETMKITPVSYSLKLSTFGFVQAIPNNFAKIAVPFAGRITKSFIRLGQKVKANDPVFEISSPSFFEAGKAFYKSKQELLLAEKNLNRQKDLFKNGVGVEKELEEAEVNFELSKREFENSSASLKVFNVNPDELVLGMPLIVRSPIAGEIVENNIVIGQYLKEDAESVVSVAELSKVWIVGQVKEKDIQNIKETDAAEVTLSGTTDTRVKGKIYHISEMLDEETRSAKVFIECPNSNRIFKPGMYVTIQFIHNPEKTLLVPLSSIFQEEKNSFVFIKTGQRSFIKKNIEISGTEKDKVIIKSGIDENDEIVINGGIYLLEMNN